MKINMKIAITDLARKRLTDDEYKYLLLLELHSGFESKINASRIKLRIPVFEKTDQIVDVAIVKQTNDSNYNKLPELGEIQRETLKIMNNLKFPITLFFAIRSILLHGDISELDSPISVYADDNPLFDRTRRQRFYYDLSFPYSGLHYPVIQIKTRLSKTELFEQIEEHWYKIEKIMKALEEEANIPILVSHISVRDIEAAILIYKYRKEGLKYKDVQKRLEKGNIFLDEPTIRKKHSELNKLLIKLGFVNN